MSAQIHPAIGLLNRGPADVRIVLVTAICLLMFLAFAQAQQRQPLPTEQDVLSGVVAQQAKANAELTVKLLRLDQELAAQRARADAAEAKLKELAPK